LRVAILVPVLRRPQNVKPLLRSISAATPEPHRVLFICDPDDTEEHEAIAAAGGEMIAPGGSYAAKINTGYRHTREPLLFTAADDLHFHPDWLSRALKHMTDGIGVVGTNDICNPRVMCGQHSTHTLVRRSYVVTQSGVVDEPDKIYHEGYAHEYCDDEFVQTAMARGVYAHAFDAIVEHRHYLVGKAEDDDTYRLGRSRTRLSRRLFIQRRRLWRT
jgi:glycosyltransferase involved in cell wall biosynthesis